MNKSKLLLRLLAGVCTGAAFAFPVYAPVLTPIATLLAGLSVDAPGQAKVS